MTSTGADICFKSYCSGELSRKHIQCTVTATLADGLKLCDARTAAEKVWNLDYIWGPYMWPNVYAIMYSISCIVSACADWKKYGYIILNTWFLSYYISIVFQIPLKWTLPEWRPTAPITTKFCGYEDNTPALIFHHCTDIVDNIHKDNSVQFEKQCEFYWWEWRLGMQCLFSSKSIKSIFFPLITIERQFWWIYQQNDLWYITHSWANINGGKGKPPLK